MKILVTGSTGFIGRHLIPKLIEQGHVVTVIARNEAKAQNFDWYNQVEFIAVDIHQPIPNPFGFFGQPDVLIHLAWEGLPNYNALFHFEETLPRDYKFLKTIIDDGLRHVIVAGTCLEYGMQYGSLSEDMPSQPINSYALAKDTLRKSLELLVAGSGVCLQWARLFYIHGSGQNQNSLLAQLDEALRKGDSVFKMSEGEQLRDYLPVGTVADRLEKLARHREFSGVVNICSGKPVSIRNLVERYVDERGGRIRFNFGYFPYPNYEPMAFWGNPCKFNTEIGE